LVPKCRLAVELAVISFQRSLNHLCFFSFCEVHLFDFREVENTGISDGSAYMQKATVALERQ